MRNESGCLELVGEVSIVTALVSAFIALLMAILMLATGTYEGILPTLAVNFALIMLVAGGICCMTIILDDIFA